MNFYVLFYVVQNVKQVSTILQCCEDFLVDDPGNVNGVGWGGIGTDLWQYNGF